MRKTNVKKHPRQMASGRTEVIRHERTVQGDGESSKATKHDVNYREPYRQLNIRYNCEDCVYFQSKSKSCKIVQGSISAKAGCDRWFGGKPIVEKS